MVNEELLFRGLPWGINIDEARALLNLPDLESLQLKDAVSSQYSVYGFQGHRVAASANSHYKNKGLVHQLWRWYSDEDSRPRIAEKMLEAIYLFFANVPKGNKLSYATMGIKFFIAIAQMLLPFVLGATVATTAAGLTSYNRLFYGCGIIYLVLFVLVFLFPLPDADQMAAGKKEGLIDSLKHTHFSFESIAMILIGFTCTGTFQLWLNCAQNFAKENVGWTDPSIMQTYYSAGTLIALVVTALLTRKIKDVRFIVIYPVICLATLIVVLTGQNQTLMIAGAFIIGWAGAGGLLQIATSVCNMLFPKIKGTVTALVMIASSLCNYTILTAASKMQPSQVMIMNIVLTAVGVVLGLFVNIRYKKMVELAEAEN